MKANTPSLQLLLLLITFFSFIPHVQAQPETGHYIPGFAGGLKRGIQPPPGAYFANSVMYFITNTFVDQNGNDINLGDDFQILANRIGLAYVSPLKFLLANYGMTLAIPIANLAPNPTTVDFASRELNYGIGDLYFRPIGLGWHFGGWHAQFAYGFFAPTGRYQVGASDNIGKGFWTNMFTVGGAYISPHKNPWYASLVIQYEIHTRKEGTNITPGQNMTLEWGIGKTLGKGVDFGIVGSALFQTTDGSPANITGGEFRYSVVSLGPELMITLPRPRLTLRIRDYVDLSAKNYSFGNSLFFEIGWKFWSPAQKKKF